MFSKSKVKFQVQELDDYVLENSVLQSKLQSKIEALTIMSKELDKCCMERDRYWILVEQLKNKNIIPREDFTIYKKSHNNTMSGAELLAKTREQNNILRLEVETLRAKLEDTTGDIGALRKQLQMLESKDTFTPTSVKCEDNTNYENLVQQLEKVQKKYQRLQLDYRATLDEKEEIVADRDYYKNKVMRLNQQISFILNKRNKVTANGESSDNIRSLLDIDAVVTENKYLHEKMTQMQIEKEIVKRSLAKCKILLNNQNKNGADYKKGIIDLMTQKEVRDILDGNCKSVFKKSSTDLKALCIALFEAVKDKNLAVQHQRKTNQILANRIAELEKTLESWYNGEKYVPIFPSQLLLNESCPDSVSTKSDDSRELQIDNLSEKYGFKNNDSDENSHDSHTSVSNGVVTGEAKIVLPLELAELVREAIAELKPNN